MLGMFADGFDQVKFVIIRGRCRRLVRRSSREWVRDTLLNRMVDLRGVEHGKPRAWPPQHAGQFWSEGSTAKGRLMLASLTW